jgi:hypothetical protein
MNLISIIERPSLFHGPQVFMPANYWEQFWT